MKIIKVDNYSITFDNEMKLTSFHAPDCCEYNYADFSQLDDIALDVEFDLPLEFEGMGYGFRFGNKPSKMFFIPCYSEQNGYYSDSVDIIFNNEEQLVVSGKMVD